MEKRNNSRSPESQRPFVVEKSTDKKDTIGGMVSVEINEKKISVPLGTTILEACRIEPGPHPYFMLS